ncbi:MAG: hypothetical protein KAT00_12955, partial [Planctomycetes bacterium]|nr:hypothetical protein [Planctomycetota bacterium]
IFCWLGCQFIAGYAEKNTPNRTKAPDLSDKTATTAKQLVEKTKDLAKKIDEAKAIRIKSIDPAPEGGKSEPGKTEPGKPGRFAKATVDRLLALVSSTPNPEAQLQAENAVMQEFNQQFEHFQDDAPACDVCGSITVRNGTCYRCYNCGNSMGCS